MNLFRVCWYCIHLANVWNALSMPSFGLCYNYKNQTSYSVAGAILRILPILIIYSS